MQLEEITGMISFKKYTESGLQGIMVDGGVVPPPLPAGFSGIWCWHEKNTVVLMKSRIISDRVLGFITGFLFSLIRYFTYRHTYPV